MPTLLPLWRAARTTGKQCGLTATGDYQPSLRSPWLAAIAAGKSPAREKARDKARVKDAETFGAWAEKWLRGYQMADSTRDMRKSVYTRELKKQFGNQKLVEITHEDLRALTDAIVDRGAPATAVHAREVMLQVYRWAIERGQKVENPADMVRPTSIARFEPRDRALTPAEIGLTYRYLNRVGTSPQYRAAIKLLLMTMVRKSELSNATWSEVNFSEALWIIPKERKRVFDFVMQNGTSKSPFCTQSLTAY